MNALTPYQSKDEVRDLASRLQISMPSGTKLTQSEAIALAQLGLAHGLDPFNGEVWLIPDSGLMVGIKGLRKCADRQATREGTIYWGDPHQVPPANYNADEKAVVYEYLLRDSRNTQAWARSIHELTTAGVPYKEAIEMLGQSPVVIGIGIATPGEKSRMPLHQRARKRAEADAIKQRFNVDFANFSLDEPDQVVITGPVSNGELSEKTQEQLLAELGFAGGEG